ncbi:MAG: putative metal-binding motif-containing protein [Deltaproteobacteria bacterium]|nr:putative metal-binding motif-containing protein [Deltaproteobacteria bacterium]
MRALTLSSLLLLSLSACGDKDAPPVDLDGDGYSSAVDCDDTDASVHPDGEERCDGLDNNCDGMVDEDPTDPTTFYADADGDGYGDQGTSTDACEAPAGYVADSGDCDDHSTAFHPGAAEYDCADPTDYNCDGSVGFADADGDGVPACEECDDSRADVHPGADEVCDEVDNNCNGMVDEEATDALLFYADLDGDGYPGDRVTQRACAAPDGYGAAVTDCDDFRAESHPGAAELCDGLDNDCDTTVPPAELDADGDGYAACEGDCDEADRATHPGGAEVCDGADNDCDGQTDEAAVDAPVWYLDADGDHYGVAGSTTRACASP